MPTAKDDTKSEQVWVSKTFSNTIIFRKLRAVFGDDPKRVELREELPHRAEISNCYLTGHALSAPDIPKIFCGQFPHTKFSKPLPDFFVANGYCLVSEKCAEVFRKFDLGEGGLEPVAVYQGDCETLVPGTYFLLNFGCRKNCFVPEKSDWRFEPMPSTAPTFWAFAGDMADDYTALSVDALRGSDLWFDTRVRSLLFFSGQLVDALRAAKVTRTIQLRRCRIEADVSVGGAL